MSVDMQKRFKRIKSEYFGINELNTAVSTGVFPSASFIL